MACRTRACSGQFCMGQTPIKAILICWLILRRRPATSRSPLSNANRNIARRAGVRAHSGGVAAEIPQRRSATGRSFVRHSERLEDYLSHIAEAIARATTYLQPFDNIGAFQKDLQTHDAVVRNIGIIGSLQTTSTVLIRISLPNIRKFHGRPCATCAMLSLMNILAWI